MNNIDFEQQSSSVERPEHLFRPHPREVFARRFLSNTTLRRAEIANIVGISAKHLSRFINGHVNLTIELARKLEACTSISAKAWMHYQVQYDLYRTTKLKTSRLLLRVNPPQICRRLHK